MNVKSLLIPFLGLLIGLAISACSLLETPTSEPTPVTQPPPPVVDPTEPSGGTGGSTPEPLILTPQVTPQGQGIFFEAEDEIEARLLPVTETWHSHEEFVGVPPISNRPGPSGGGNWYLSRNGEALVYEFDVQLSGDYRIFVRDFSSDDWPPGYRSMMIAVDGSDLGVFDENDIRAAYPPGAFGWHETATVTLEIGRHTLVVTKEGPVQAGPLLDAFYLTTNPDDNPENTLTLEIVLPTPDGADNGTNGGTLLEQYASTAIAFTEYSSDDWSADQATGPPNTANCGDYTTAWAPADSLDSTQWLEARFETPVYATGLSIYESYESGFVKKVEFIDDQGQYRTAWAGIDETDCPGELELNFEQTSYPVVGVKIHTLILGYEEIDAVKITGIAADTGQTVTPTPNPPVTVVPTADDHGNRYTTATALLVGGSTPGSLEQLGDEDWFSFAANVGWVYVIAATPGSLRDPFLRLIDRGGASRIITDEDGGSGEIALIEWVAPTVGTYYVSVSAGDEDSSGTYSISVSGRRDDYGSSAIGASSVPVGGLLSGELEAIGDDDWFFFDAQRGSRYRINTILGTLPDSYLTVSDTDGKSRLQTDDDGGAGQASLIDWVAPETGTYYVSVRAPGSDLTGTYTLNIDTPANATRTVEVSDDHSDNWNEATSVSVKNDVANSVTLDGSITATFENPEDQDWFKFVAQAGWVYRINVNLVSLVDSHIGFYDTSGITRIKFDENRGPSRVEWTAPSTGVYFVLVRSLLNENTGTYTLNISGEPDDYANDWARAEQIPVGTVVANYVSVGGNLEEAADEDWFSFGAKAGWVYRFNADMVSLVDSHVALLQTDGITRIAFDENQGPSRLEWTAPGTGTYFVMLRSLLRSEIGSYILTISGEPDDHEPYWATVVRDDSPVVGDSEIVSDDDWFAFSAQGGSTYDLAVDLVSLADSHIGVWDTDGFSRLSFDENRGPSRIQGWTAPSTGTYFVEVRSLLSGEMGGYILTISGEFASDVTGGADTDKIGLPVSTRLITARASAERPIGSFGSNTVFVDIPETGRLIIVSADPHDLVPAGIDDRVSLRVTGPSGRIQQAFLYDNGPCNDPIGEQWIASNVIEFEEGLNKIEVSLENVFNPPGSNSASPALYLIVLLPGSAAPDPPTWGSTC